MERLRFKETVFLDTSDSLFLLVHNYLGSNFIGQYLAGHLGFIFIVRGQLFRWQNT